MCEESLAFRYLKHLLPHWRHSITSFDKYTRGIVLDDIPGILAGGAIRDRIAGKTVRDLDFYLADNDTTRNYISHLLYLGATDEWDDLYEEHEYIREMYTLPEFVTGFVKMQFIITKLEPLDAVSMFDCNLSQVAFVLVPGGVRLLYTYRFKLGMERKEYTFRRSAHPIYKSKIRHKFYDWKEVGMYYE